eukprot:5484273-Prymnesium_polylepis.1
MSYCGIRYVMLDSIRANLQKVSAQIHGWQFYFTKAANGLYAFFLLFWPMLLVVTPDIDTILREPPPARAHGRASTCTAPHALLRTRWQLRSD